MKLLIITQVIDIEHPILGFFHRWVEEFAKHCEHVHVICLQEGKHDLPENVTVHSLGKNEGKGRFVYLLRFYSLIWKLRHEYESVFVHMNQIYVILGAPFWRAIGKKVGLWYAHGTVTPSLKIAVFLSNKIFTSTEQGMRIETPKRMIVGQGIDTETFYSIDKTEPNETLELITVGRVSVSKNIDTLVKACAELKKQQVKFSFKIIGLPTVQSEIEYFDRMKDLVTDLRLEDEIKWVGPVPQADLPTYLQTSDIFIHDGSTDSLDKTLLEAVLCGCVVISSNPSYMSLTGSLSPSLLFSPHDHIALASIISSVVEKDVFSRKKLTLPIYRFVHDSFNISTLISGIVNHYEKKI